VSLLDISELKKDTDVTGSVLKSITCLRTSHSLSMFHISLHRLLVLHLRLFLFHCSCLYLHLLLGILRQCHLETLRSHMHQHRYGSQLRISELYILIAKKFLPLNQFRSTSPVDGPPIQPSAPPFDLDAPIAFRKGKRYCTVHPISNFVSYDHLNAVSILVF